MKKYLISGFFIFMFAFIYQISTLQGQWSQNLTLEGQSRTSSYRSSSQYGRGIDGRCGRDIITLCESGSFILIHRIDARIHYACSGSSGGSSILCDKIIY